MINLAERRTALLGVNSPSSRYRRSDGKIVVIGSDLEHHLLVLFVAHLLGVGARFGANIVDR